MEDRPSTKQNTHDANQADMRKRFPYTKPDKTGYNRRYRDADQVKGLDVAVFMTMFALVIGMRLVFMFMDMPRNAHQFRPAGIFISRHFIGRSLCLQHGSLFSVSDCAQSPSIHPLLFRAP